MKLKSYFAATVEAAMNMARLELGSDAMLVSSKRTDDLSRHLGAYEVVFAATVEGRSFGANSSSQPVAQTFPARPAQVDKLSAEIAGLRREMERMAAGFARSTAGIAKIAANATLAEAFSNLVDAEMDADLAQDIVWRIASQLDGTGVVNPVRFYSLLAVELSHLLHVDSGWAGNTGRNAIALVGPPGAGKTSTLVKLAVMYGLRTRRPCQILSLDTQRVAASEQLRSYAAITGLGFQALETPRSLIQALEEHRTKDLIFIDTPGLAGNDFEDAIDLAKLISKQPQIETHLVLSASMKPADMKRISLQYEMFAPSKLIFTHLDETQTFGSLLSLSIKSGKPISFISRGQQIPEDLEAADSRSLVDLVVRNAPSAGEELSSIAAA